MLRGGVIKNLSDVSIVKILSTTHLHCHSHLLGKELNALASRDRIQWLSPEHKTCQGRTCRSSTRQRVSGPVPRPGPVVRGCRWSSHCGNPGLQGGCRVGQGWVELGKCILTLVEMLEKQPNKFTVIISMTMFYSILGSNLVRKCIHVYMNTFNSYLVSPQSSSSSNRSLDVRD